MAKVLILTLAIMMFLGSTVLVFSESDKMACTNPKHILVERGNDRLACVYESTAEKLGWKIVKQIEFPEIQPTKKISSLPSPNELSKIQSISTGSTLGDGYPCTTYNSFITITPAIISIGTVCYEVTWTELDFETCLYSSGELPFTQEKWDSLISLVDLKKFNALPNHIGCAGCMDNSVSYIEIVNGYKSKSIRYEYQDLPPEIFDFDFALYEIFSNSTLVELSCTPEKFATAYIPPLS